MQPRRARGHLFGCRRPIAEPFAGRIRAAFQDVRDVHLIARKPHRLDDLGEQLAGLTHERLACIILIGPRCFAHKHQIRGGVAYSEHHVFT